MFKLYRVNQYLKGNLFEYFTEFRKKIVQKILQRIANLLLALTVVYITYRQASLLINLLFFFFIFGFIHNSRFRIVNPDSVSNYDHHSERKNAKPNLQRQQQRKIDSPTPFARSANTILFSIRYLYIIIYIYQVAIHMRIFLGNIPIHFIFFFPFFFFLQFFNFS